MGFTGLALGAMLFRDGVARADSSSAGNGWHPPDGQPHFAPRAKAVIWIFLCGGVSHLESFDVKPELNKYAGKSIAETPYASVLAAEGKDVIGANPAHGNRKVIMPLQTGYKTYGQCGLVVGDWFKNIGECADDLAVVRSLWTIHNDHGAQLTWQTGRHPRELEHPTLGSWVCYGLGTVNENLPQFVVMGGGPGDCCGGVGAHTASYLGPEHSGVNMALDPANPLPFGTPGTSVSLAERRDQLDLLNELNGIAGAQYPDDPAMRARIRSYELAFRMQMSVPEVVRLSDETQHTQELYGLNEPSTERVGRFSLAARRLVERGVRFVQIYDDGWDAHSELIKNHSTRCKAVDKPIAGLLKDLKQRGLLEETLVVWATEFGRTPGAERSDGRDHHPYGFSVWMAGGGLKRGVVHGATDEIGFHAVEHRHYVTDIHATLLHQLGLDSHRLEFPGQKRLEIDFGTPIHDIIA